MLERQLLDEVLELKDQVQHLAVAIERQTNAIAQTQMISTRDIESHGKRLLSIEEWRAGLEAERAEQRGAARMRKSLLAVIAGAASLFGGGVAALVNYLLRLGG